LLLYLFEQEVVVRNGCVFPTSFVLESEFCRALLLVWFVVRSVFADVKEVEKDNAAEVGLGLSKCWSCLGDCLQVLEDRDWDGNCLLW
jgi:hypothetical protein